MKMVMWRSRKRKKRRMENKNKGRRGREGQWKRKRKEEAIRDVSPPIEADTLRYAQMQSLCVTI